MLPRLRRPKLVWPLQMATWPELGRERVRGSSYSVTEFVLAVTNLGCRRRASPIGRALLAPTSGRSNRDNGIRASTPWPVWRPLSTSTLPTWSAAFKTCEADGRPPGPSGPNGQPDRINRHAGVGQDVGTTGEQLQCRAVGDAGVITDLASAGRPPDPSRPNSRVYGARPGSGAASAPCRSVRRWPAPGAHRATPSSWRGAVAHRAGDRS